MDELWSFLKKRNFNLGVFIGFDVDSCFWINFQLGSRTNHNVKKLVTGIKVWLKSSVENTLKITTDKLAAYKNAIKSVLKDIPHVYMWSNAEKTNDWSQWKNFLLKERKRILQVKRKIHLILSDSI